MEDNVFEKVIENYDEFGFPKARRRGKIIPENNENSTTENSTTNTGEEAKTTTDVAESFQQLLEADTISEKEEIFIDEYIHKLDSKEALRKIYPNMSEDFLRSKSVKLLEKPAIKAEVSKQINKLVDSSVARSPFLLMKYIEKFLSMSVRDYYYDNGNAKPLSEIPDDALCLIDGIQKIVNNKSGTETVIYSLPNKMKALDKLSDLVKFISQARAVAGNEFDPSQETAKEMRDAIFNSIPEKEPEEPVVAPKRGRGRPRKE